MSTVAAARDRLIATLETSGLRVLRDVGRSPDTPCLMIPLPTLTYDVYASGPTSASFQVPLVVSAPSVSSTGSMKRTPPRSGKGSVLASTPA